MLRAGVAKRRGGFTLDLALAIEPAATLVVVGESGGGKTTLLRILAGLDRPDSGRIVLDDEVYFDHGSGVLVQAWQRDIGYMAQDYALFPHLTVWDNVAFGLRARRIPSRLVRSHVGEMLEQVAIADLGSRRPDQLSGGQQQRVALARALVMQPRLLLLDEPLSALDLQTRGAVRGELRRLLGMLSCITVLVTHSPVEALVFGDQVAVIESGRLTQVGSRDDLLRHPRTPYVAAFAGVNLFHGRVVDRLAGGLARVETANGALSVIDPGGDAEVFLAVNPREISLFLAPPAGSAQNTFRGRITELVPEPPLGERVRVALDTHPPLVAEVTRQAVTSLGLEPGLEIYATFKATGVLAYR